MSNESIDLGIPGLTRLERIGSGGSAVVYRARQPELDRTVVVKVIMAVDADVTRRRFDRERRAMGRLSQAVGIAPVYDSGFTKNGQPYLIMPFYEQGSLQDWLETRDPLSPQEVRAIGVSICRSVQTAHESGVVHRDLKPANILMAKNGRPDVADFGIARLVDETGGASQALTMTPLYTAPEVFDGVDSAEAGDIYSLGALLYAVLNGRPAYTDESGTVPMLALMRRINEDPLPPLPPSTPRDLATVIAKAMDKDPERRFRSAGEMADALEAADLTTAAPGRSYLLPLIAILVLAAAIGAAVLAATLLRGNDTASPVDPEPRPTPTSEPEQTPTPPPTTDSSPVTSSFDPDIALAAARAAAVDIEAYGCTGVELEKGLALPDGRVLTDAQVLQSPWHVSVIADGQAYIATPLTSDRNRRLAMVRMANANVLDAPPISTVAAGAIVAVVGPQGGHVEATVGQDGELLGDEENLIRHGDTVVTPSGEIVGVASSIDGVSTVLSIEQLDREWTRSPARYDCATLVRDLDADDVDRVVSTDIAELLQMQRLSNAYASEDWDLVRELEPGKQSLSDQAFIDGWRPLRQGYVFPVHRGETVDGHARWRIGLIGEETWFGRDLTTLFCVTWTVDGDTGAIVQTNEDTIRIYGSQPGQQQREGFVDPGNLRVLIDQNCPLGP